MEQKHLKLEELDGGGPLEVVNHELQSVLENLLDPNTEPKKERKVTLEIKIKGDENRNMCGLTYQAKSTLAPAMANMTAIIVDQDENGKAVAAEVRPGSIPGQQELPVNRDNIREIPTKEKG